MKQCDSIISFNCDVSSSLHLLTSQHLGKSRQMKCEHSNTSRRLNWVNVQRRVERRMNRSELKQRELKEQTWFEAADSAKGTLVTGVEADETVEVVAPCIMGTFIRAFQTKDRGRGCGREGGEGTGMIWLPWQNVQDQKSWHKSSDIARMNLNKYQDTCKREKGNYIYFYIRQKERKGRFTLTNEQRNKAIHHHTIQSDWTIW